MTSTIKTHTNLFAASSLLTKRHLVDIHPTFGIHNIHNSQDPSTPMTTMEEAKLAMEYSKEPMPAGTRESAMNVAAQAVDEFGSEKEDVAAADQAIVNHIKQALDTMRAGGIADWHCALNRNRKTFMTVSTGGPNYALLLRVGIFNVLIWAGRQTDTPWVIV